MSSTFSIETDNIKSTLKSIFRGDSDEIDFELLETKSQCFKYDNNQVLPVEMNALVIDDVLDEKFEIKQTYKISISPKKKHAFDSHIRLVMSKTKTLLQVQIKAAHYDFCKNLQANEIEVFLINSVRKKMAYHGIPIHFFDTPLKQNAQQIAQQIYSSGSLSDDLLLHVLDTRIAPIFPNPQQLSSLYLKKQALTGNDRGAFVEIKSGETILLLIKPVNGRSGRNIFGEFIRVDAVDYKIVEPSIGQNIQRIEHHNRIEYISTIDGFVSSAGKVIEVVTSKDIQEISFKSTGDINCANARLSVGANTKHDHSLDAVGSGVSLNVDALKVHGSTGKTILKAQTIAVTGSTHKDSISFSKEADIKCHKGYLQALEVNLENLDGGKVEADIINIQKAVGGVVRGNEVNIDKLYSNCTVIASKKISIGTIYGKENKLCIEYGFNQEELHEAENVAKELIIAQQKMRLTREVIEKLQRDIKERNPHIGNCKKAQQVALERGLSLDNKIVSALKAYEDIKEKITQLNKQSTELRKTISSAKTKIINLSKSIESTTIVIENVKHNENFISFKTFHDKDNPLTQELSLKEYPTVYTLKRDEQERFIITTLEKGVN